MKVIYVIILVDDVGRDFPVDDLLEEGLAGGRSGGCGGLRLGLFVGHCKLEKRGQIEA